MTEPSLEAKTSNPGTNDLSYAQPASLSLKGPLFLLPCWSPPNVCGVFDTQNGDPSSSLRAPDSQTAMFSDCCLGEKENPCVMNTGGDRVGAPPRFFCVSYGPVMQDSKADQGTFLRDEVA